MRLSEKVKLPLWSEPPLWRTVARSKLDGVVRTGCMDARESPRGTTIIELPYRDVELVNAPFKRLARHIEELASRGELKSLTFEFEVIDDRPPKCTARLIRAEAIAEGVKVKSMGGKTISERYQIMLRIYEDMSTSMAVKACT